MDTSKIKDLLSIEDIVRIVTDGLGSNGNLWDSEGRPIFQSIDHNEPGYGSYKLYYYPETKLFHSYTAADSMDIFELVQRSKHLENFINAYKYVLEFFGLREQRQGFIAPTNALTDDWEILKKFEFFENTSKSTVQPPIIPENRLSLFGELAAPIEWLRDHISAEVMRQFGIRVDSANQRIIIPHRDINGNLIGIRCRNFDLFDLEQGRKYMPVAVSELNETYKHPLGANLYGLFENQQCIRNTKKIMICESEKAVLQAKTVWKDNCFVVATCGSSLSPTQMDIIIGLGVEKLILAYDRENDEDPNSELTKSYEAKLLRIVQPLAKYMDVYILFDYDCLLPYKASPTDEGEDILLQLMKKKIYISSIEVETKKRRKNK